MIITHAALILQEVPPGDPELRRGMPVARCGWQNDGHGVAVAWERRFVDCPMCLLMIDDIPVIGVASAEIVHGDGEPLPVRTPKRPDYVPIGAIYHPIEFTGEHPRGRGLRHHLWIALSAVLAIAALMTIFALFTAYSRDAGPAPAPTATPTTYGPPARADIIWTR